MPVPLAPFARALQRLEGSHEASAAYFERLDRALALTFTPGLEDVVAAVRELSARQDAPRPVQRLRLLRIRVESPGFADLDGASGPFESLRRLRVDRDERRKDREWREALERTHMELENERLQHEVDKAGAAAEMDQLEVLRKRFQLLAELLGVDEARRAMAKKLLAASDALDEADIAHEPVLLPPSGDTGASGEDSEDQGRGGGGSASGEEGDGPSGPSPGSDGPSGGGGSNNGDDNGDDDEPDGTGSGGDEAEREDWLDDDEENVDAYGRELVTP